MDKFIKILFALLLVNSAFGQNQVEMADQLRAEGKIYVVVTIILIVLAGLIFYLFLLDKKVKKLEKLVSDKKKQTN
jgi:phosphoglycerol transferase MdoB-like AlkP superfamily enzyme